MGHAAKGNAVHLWCAKVPESVNGSVRDRLLGLLDEREVLRMRRFRRATDRDHYLSAHALCRTARSQADEEVHPAEWRFEAGLYGKPFVVAPDHAGALHFNLSHAQGLCAVVIGSVPELGVDVEALERRVDRMSVGRHSFASSEFKDVERLEGCDQRDQFFRYWTLKEAYIKARGLGMRIPLRDFAFDLRAEPIAISFVEGFDDSPKGWHFIELELSPTHRAALALRCPDGWVLHTHWREAGAL